MKILFLSENFPPETNAAATRVFERAVHWIKDGHQVTVITCAPNFPNGVLFDGYKNHWHQTEVMSGIKVVRVKTFISANAGVFFRSLDFCSFGLMSFVTGCIERRPDLVVATSPQFFSAVSGWAISACRGLPFVFELGDIWPSSISAVEVFDKKFVLRIFEKIELFLYNHSTRIAALTNAFKKNLVSRGVEETKIDVVLNGVDLTRYYPQSTNAALSNDLSLQNKFVVGYIGTHGMAHALENVLRAAEMLVHLKNIRFLFVGAGAQREGLINAAKEKNINNVIFLPMQPKEKMPDIWSLCDVALVHLKDHPAFAEVIPSKIFEAMAMGLPILLSAPEGEARQIVSNHDAGIWVPPENPDLLANAVHDLYLNPELRKAFSNNSLASAVHHTRKGQAKAMISVFQKALMTNQIDRKIL